MDKMKQDAVSANYTKKNNRYVLARSINLLYNLNFLRGYYVVEKTSLFGLEIGFSLIETHESLL